MKKHKWEILAAVALLALAFVLHFMHYRMFHDLHHLFLYGMGDLAFLPLEVLIVSLILHRLLERRDKRARLSKMNMIIGVFFSQVGTKLLHEIMSLDKNASLVKESVSVSAQWGGKDYARAIRAAGDHKFDIEFSSNAFVVIKDLLEKERAFLVGLLQNPVLLEHKSFTNLLWAVFHFAEELGYRDDLSKVTENDAKHLIGDANRVAGLLLKEWLSYVKHLKVSYPYLFSLALRLDPFEKNVNVTVK